MARILFFGWLADLAGTRIMEHSLEHLSLRHGALSVQTLIQDIRETNDTLGLALLEKSTKVVVNEELVERHQSISDSDEIAFLPPVSGG